MDVAGWASTGIAARPVSRLTAQKERGEEEEWTDMRRRRPPRDKCGGMLGLKAVTKGKGGSGGSLPVDMESFNDLGVKSLLFFWLSQSCNKYNFQKLILISPLSGFS